MGKYTDALLAVFSVFGSPAWVAEGITTLPQGYTGAAPSTQFIRVSVIASGGSINRVSTSGLLMISIFTPNGAGPSAAAGIADKLDSFLVGANFNQEEGICTQLIGASNFSIRGVDVSSPTLLHSLYQIQFSHFNPNL